MNTMVMGWLIDFWIQFNISHMPASASTITTVHRPPSVAFDISYKCSHITSLLKQGGIITSVLPVAGHTAPYIWADSTLGRVPFLVQILSLYFLAKACFILKPRISSIKATRILFRPFRLISYLLGLKWSSKAKASPTS